MINSTPRLLHNVSFAAVMLSRLLRTGALCIAVLLAACSDDSSSSGQSGGKSPNILFVIMDDVGIDQMRALGYGGVEAAETPNIGAIAGRGLRFRNTWAMPECSPSRAMFFTGRYPLRTNVTNAITSSDLANSQMSPYEYTTPKLLKARGYTNAIFGKTHFSGSPVNPALNPYGYTAPHQLGWDTFAGWADGAPNPIDSTAGGIAAKGTYACGFVPNSADDPVHGADMGACYTVDGACAVLSNSSGSPTPGRSCMERGGILVPNAQCETPRPAAVDFTVQNAYYVSELITNDENGVAKVYPADDASGIGRRYRTEIESQLAIDWIRARPAGKPWMATLSFSSAHAPYQAPPSGLLPAGSANTDGYDCDNTLQLRTLMKQMIESMDQQLGRVLVETGIATRNSDGSLAYDPQHSNTMVVIVGDNGSYTLTVKAPFDPSHAKAYVNQTGVWVPLIVAGPQVVAPDRDVAGLVNIADLYQLFAELAGVDVHEAVPATRALDSVTMLPYLKYPEQPSLRSTNWTQTADNLRATTTVQGACVIESANVCTPLFPQQGLCEMEGGTWYGAGSTQPGVPAGGFASCCDVQKLQINLGQAPVSVLPSSQIAVRNLTHKLIRTEAQTYEQGSDQCVTETDTGFYSVNEDVPIPRIDFPQLALPIANLSGADLASYQQLTAEMQRVSDSNVPCPGDGNSDGIVDAKDLADLTYWRGVVDDSSSWFDFNLDGLTDEADIAILEANFNTRCAKPR
jgi:arylsulfatase A-like enzyme